MGLVSARAVFADLHCGVFLQSARGIVVCVLPLPARSLTARVA